MAELQKRLSEAEMAQVIHSHCIGVLSLTNGEQPYSIPMEYVFHGDAIYMGTPLTGRKVEYMAANPKACFLIYESRHESPDLVSKGIPCRSVLLEGRLSQEKKKSFQFGTGARTFQLLKLTVESTGSWTCTNRPCSLVSGRDTQKELLEWIGQK